VRGKKGYRYADKKRSHADLQPLDRDQMDNIASHARREIGKLHATIAGKGSAPRGGDRNEHQRKVSDVNSWHADKLWEAGYTVGPGKWDEKDARILSGTGRSYNHARVTANMKNQGLTLIPHGEFDRGRYVDHYSNSKTKGGKLVKAIGLFSSADRLIKAGGPFIGPKGGKWADAQHTIPWRQDVKAHFHSAPAHHLESIQEKGLKARKGSGTYDHGGYREHSQGKVFLAAHHEAARNWHGKVEDMMMHKHDDESKHKVVMLRVKPQEKTCPARSRCVTTSRLRTLNTMTKSTVGGRSNIGQKAAAASSKRKTRTSLGQRQTA
jgi:hypothetical protein